MSSLYLRALTCFLPFLALLGLTIVAKSIRVDSPDGAGHYPERDAAGAQGLRNGTVVLP